jgi:S-adenosylmethionine-diacylglycerol 3-amino-3-carboxypropyl transferase
MSGPMLASSTNEATRVLARGELRYSTVWEDHLLLERGLGIGPRDDVLMICSAGCNVLNALLHGPRRIVALDVNPAQTALLELKLAAIRGLEHAQLLELIGVRESSERLALYERVRRSLSAGARGWWDDHTPVIEQGIEQSGRLERYVATFRTEHLLRLVDRSAVERIFTLRRAARSKHLEDEILTPELLRAFREYFTREALAERGRDPAQFRHVAPVDVAGWFLQRLRWVCTELPTAGNFYLQRFLLGGSLDRERDVPYLRADSLRRLRRFAPRVEIVNDQLHSYLTSRSASTTTKAGLSDVFEYMSETESAAVFHQLARTIRPGGRIAYWNLFVPRRSPPSARLRLRPLERRSRVLSRRDRSWFYRAFHVEAVCDV